MTLAPDHSASTVDAALSHPLVLRGAWLRVNAWYQSGNLAPQPELARWRLHPERELRRLGDELRSGDWKPIPWRQLPYPKKGACLRHYVLPTVRDQVAFMAHMVLLGPCLDHQFMNFTFGNRWYRPIAWERRLSPARWVHRAYPLLTPKSYLSYARSHGLYRRVAHWTVARMTGAAVPREDYGGPVQHPTDYSDESLPPWVSEDWWPSESTGRRAFWAALDIELAYPSVQLDGLRRAFTDLFADAGPLKRLLFHSPPLSGYPSAIQQVLGRHEELLRLGSRLVNALERVEIVEGVTPRDAWSSHHSRSRVPPENKGLPTGLAISGVLLNAALHSTDKRILQYLRTREGDQRGAVVRFADDMYLLSKSSQGLLDLIDEVWRGLTGSDDTTLAATASTSNLYLNLGKIEPAAVKAVVEVYLDRQGWKECKVCKQLCPPRGQHEARPLGNWWATTGEDQDFQGHRESLDRSAVGRNEVGPFVTTLVARLSELGTDTLTERFGEGARNRLGRLHELARFDINDEQVRADTRRSFAVNRLVRAWLPLDDSLAREALSDIRDSVAHVLGETPWKFSLWRSVVRAAARRPNGQDGEAGNTEAKTWLSDQLRRIAQVPTTAGPTSWMHTWPEAGANKGHDRDPSWLDLHLSFHRTAFWHALGDLLRELWRHHDRMVPRRPDDPGPPPHWWTVRAIPTSGHGGVARFLGALDQWLNVLYPPDEPLPDLRQRPWELDQLAATALASLQRGALAKAWSRAARPTQLLVVPEGPLSEQAPATAEMLRRLERVVPDQGLEQALNLPAVAHLQLAGRDRQLGRFLFPSGKPPRILGTHQDPTHTVAIGVALGCSESISRGLVDQLVPAPSASVRNTKDDALTLLEYGRARRILLG